MTKRPNRTPNVPPYFKGLKNRDHKGGKQTSRPLKKQQEEFQKEPQLHLSYQVHLKWQLRLQLLRKLSNQSLFRDEKKHIKGKDRKKRKEIQAIASGKVIRPREIYRTFKKIAPRKMSKSCAETNKIINKKVPDTKTISKLSAVGIVDASRTILIREKSRLIFA